MEEDLPSQCSPPKQAGVSKFISEEAKFKLKLIKRDKEGHSILIKGEMHPVSSNIL
jgi:hypothetical protein